MKSLFYEALFAHFIYCNGIARNQRKLDDVLEHLFRSLLGDGRASVGKGIFHLQYTLLGKHGPFSKKSGQVLRSGLCTMH